MDAGTPNPSVNGLHRDLLAFKTLTTLLSIVCHYQTPFKLRPEKVNNLTTGERTALALCNALSTILVMAKEVVATGVNFDNMLRDSKVQVIVSAGLYDRSLEHSRVQASDVIEKQPLPTSATPSVPRIICPQKPDLFSQLEASFNNKVEALDEYIQALLRGGLVPL